MPKFNLIFFHIPQRQDMSDFVALRGIIARLAPDIEVHIVSPELPVPRADFWRKAAQRPTVLFSPMPLPRDARVRGFRLVATRLSKFQEANRLAEAGFPVPFIRKIMPDTVLDERQWGPFTVVKPNTGYRGRGIRLMRTRDVRWIDTQKLGADDPRHGKNLIAQQFIDTGPYATCHRVMTVLGRRVYAMQSTAVEPVPPLLGFPDGPVDIEIAANGVPRRMVLFDDAEIIALAEQIHARLPYTPVMGIDIIREHQTGKLFVLEVNGGGWTWHLSSAHGRKNQKDHGMDYYAQFNALDVIADALIKVTRRKAV